MAHRPNFPTNSPTANGRGTTGRGSFPDVEGTALPPPAPWPGIWISCMGAGARHRAFARGSSGRWKWVGGVGGKCWGNGWVAGCLAGGDGGELGGWLAGWLGNWVGGYVGRGATKDHRGRVRGEGVVLEGHGGNTTSLIGIWALAS